jgi:hypothetical protein
VAMRSTPGRHRCPDCQHDVEDRASDAHPAEENTSSGDSPAVFVTFSSA